MGAISDAGHDDQTADRRHPAAAPELAAALAAVTRTAGVDDPLPADLEDRLVVHLARAAGALGLAAWHLARLADRAAAATTASTQPGELLRRPARQGERELRLAVDRLEGTTGRRDVAEADLCAAVEAWTRDGPLAPRARRAVVRALGEAAVERIAAIAGYVHLARVRTAGAAADAVAREVRARLADHADLAELLLAAPAAAVSAEPDPDAPLLRLALDGAAQGTWDYDLAADRPTWDERTFALFGLEPSAPLSWGRVLADYVHPDDRDRVEQAARAAVDPGGDGRYAIEHRVRRGDGAERWVAVTGRTLFEERDGERRPMRMLGVVRDVTADVETRRRAEANAERLRHALEAAEASAWEWSPQAERPWWSPENFALFGLDPDAGAPTFGEWLEHRVHPEDRARLERELAAVLAGDGDAFTFEFRIEHPERGVRWITARGRIRRDRDGAARHLSGINFDSTARHRTEEALGESRAQLERQWAELETLYAEAPLGLGMLDRDLRFVRINAALAEINGFAPEAHLGRFAWDLLPDLRESAEPMFRKLLETGEAQRDVPVHGTTPAQPGVEREWREHFYPVTDGRGSIIGIGIVCEEVTATRRAERQRELLIDELNHRVKNTLAVVQALAHQTFKPGVEPEAARLAFARRLQALAGAHELLTRANWEAASLSQLAAAVVRSAAPQDAPVRTDGPAVMIPPKMAVTLAMTLNELCTNAVKYGALSAETGAVDLSWRYLGERRDRVALTWRERDGPAVRPPTRTGFGLTMIEHALAREFGAEVAVDFAPAGLVCRIALPLARPAPAPS